MTEEDKKPKSFMEAYRALTQEDWHRIIQKANEMQLETLRKAEEMRETEKYPSELD